MGTPAASRVVVVIASLFGLIAGPSLAASHGPFDNCPDALNAFAQHKTGLPFDLPWLGVKKSTQQPFGWTRLSFPSFDSILLRAGLAPAAIERMKSWMRLIRIEGVDAAKLSPDDPAVLASFALAAFMKLSFEEPEFVVYAALLPDVFAAALPDDGASRFIAGGGNFYFEDENKLATLPRLETRGLSLQRPKQAILLRDLLPDSTEEVQQEWFADLMGAMQRRSDYALVSTALSRDLHLTSPVVKALVARGDGGLIALASPAFPVMIETRGELVRAWTLHRIRGTAWNLADTHIEERALSRVADLTGVERVEPYLDMEGGVYARHTVPLVQALRNAR